MNTERQGPTVPELEHLDWEAAHWVLRLEESCPGSPEPHDDGRGRTEAFLHWLTASPAHVRAFFESFETYRRVGEAAAAGSTALRAGASPTRAG